MARRGIALLCFALAVTAAAWSPGGGLDGSGGHNDRKNGGYHFHRGPLAGQSFSSKAAAMRALQGDAKPEPAKETPRSAAEPARVAAPPAKSEAGKSAVVYVTRTGTKYHGAGCQYLRASQREIELDDAIAEGYSACSRCRGR